MKKFIISGVTLVALVGAAVAFAADFNSYTATQTFSPSASGSASHPSPFATHELWTAKGNNGHKAGVLTKIVAKVYGEKTNGKNFPVCTAKMINAAGNSKGWNKVCPKGSLIGQGPVKSLFVPSADPTAAGSPCNPYLTVYNGGPKTQVFFFEEAPQAPGPQYTCLGGGVHTGAAPAYNGTISYSGKTWIETIPLPPTVSTTPGGIHGVYASLIRLDVKYAKTTKKVNGKTVGYAESIACQNNKRPYSFTFTAKNYTGQQPPSQTTTVSHTASC